ncbi:MAG: hypothetical protein WDM76_16285 [Limisphaerales bacterium]
MLVDVMYKGLNSLSHKSGNNAGGLDAAFGDGHVAWQGVKKQPNVFNPVVWEKIEPAPPDGNGSSSAPDFMYVMSLFQP